jgi:hypothetical protein
MRCEFKLCTATCLGRGSEGLMTWPRARCGRWRHSTDSGVWPPRFQRVARGVRGMRGSGALSTSTMIVQMRQGGWSAVSRASWTAWTLSLLRPLTRQHHWERDASPP